MDTDQNQVLSHYIVDVDQVLNWDPQLWRSRVGGKGSSLCELHQWGMAVPEFRIITVDAFRTTLKLNNLEYVLDILDHPNKDLPCTIEQLHKVIIDCDFPTQIEQQITEFVHSCDAESFAVRSSGTVEDGDTHSFAGLYHTSLNLNAVKDIINAVKTCWVGLFSETVRAYLKTSRVTQSVGMAVVLQTLVSAEKSGVVFTVDPVRGIDREMLIEACFGLGEALVSGEVSPDQYRYDWYKECIVEKNVADKEVQCVRIDEFPFTKIVAVEENKITQSVLYDEEIKQLAKISLHIQSCSKRPVDIEWAKQDDQFYVLQSRPITEIGYAAIEGEWTTADLRDGGVSSTVCSPYMASLYKYVMDVTMGDYLRGLGFPARSSKEIWLKSFFARPYWNLEAVKHALSQIPDFNERAFDEGLGIAPRYEGDGIVSKITPKSLFLGLRALYRIKQNCKKRLKECPEFSKRQQQRLKELKDIDFAAMENSELFNFAERFLLEEYFHNEASYFYFVYDNANLNSLFKDKIDKLAFDQSQYPALLSGLKGVSHLAQIEGLWEMRKSIKCSAKSRQYWQSTPSKQIALDFENGTREYYLDRLADYLDRFGHHSKQELDLMVPRYREDITYVIDELKYVLRQADENDPHKRNAHQQLAAEKAQQELLQCVPKWKSRNVLNSLRQVRQFLWWREELRDLSTRFYYYVRKITLLVEQRLIQIGRLAKEGDVFFLELPDLIALMKETLSSAECGKIVSKNRLYYRSFNNYTIPDEIGQRYSGAMGAEYSDKQQSLSVLGKGVPGSAGIVTATARVVESIHFADKLQAGDILITRCTDPGWTPKFTLLSGVVTETGGILSHAAVICREYGIPAVLAVKNATRIIQDGDTICVDGNAGEIRVVETDGISSKLNLNDQTSSTVSSEAIV